MSSKWRAAQGLCLLLDVCCLGGIACGKGKWAAILFGLHGAGWLLFGRRVGRLSGMPDWKSFIWSFLLGFTWWLPQNDLTHRKIEAQVDQSRFKAKASGIKLEENNKE